VPLIHSPPAKPVTYCRKPAAADPEQGNKAKEPKHDSEVRMSDHGFKEPSTLSFESRRTRVWILTSYLVIVILALPLWWSTTSIERLSLPVSRVDALSGKEVSLLC